ncbi:MAG: PilZ domain-containing protein [Terriglobales bacterium]
MDILLLSRDPKLITATNLACANIGASLQLCNEASEGVERVARRKIYAVMVDEADRWGALELLGAVRKSPSSKNAVSIAIESGSKGIGLGTMLVLPKAPSADMILRTLRAAHGPMSAERRRYLRHPLEAPVSITTASNVIQAMSINLSLAGLAVRLAGAEPNLIGGTPMRARLILDPLSSPVELTGDVAWSDERLAGLHHQCVSQKDQIQLQRWLAEQANPGAERGSAGDLFKW